MRVLRYHQAAATPPASADAAAITPSLSQPDECDAAGLVVEEVEDSKALVIDFLAVFPCGVCHLNHRKSHLF